MKPSHLLLAATMSLAVSVPAQAKVEHLLPRVQQLSRGQGSFDLGGNIALTDPTDCVILRDFLAANATVGTQGKPVTVEIVDAIPGAFNHNVADYPHESYTLTVTPEAVNIKALTPTGVIRATQTMMQMALGYDGTPALEAVEITDWPAFKVRGFMHDVGRSFISVKELKEQIELLSQFKVNTFHWHLTDYTGWRFEVKAYDALTGPKGITRDPGKFYSQDDCKMLQDFAAERGMTVIPEIDMPGHSHPFQNALGYTMTSDQGKATLRTILNEVVSVFDKAPYIHIGGDEIHFDDNFLIEMIDYIHGLGKKVVIWNQYNAGPAKKVNPAVIPTDMTTNWATSGTLSEGVPNIDMRYNYTNHFDVFADLVGIYKSSIFYVPQGNDNVGGTISAAWNDTKTKTEIDIIRQNNIYANIIASGERAWIGGGKQYIETGGVTLPNSGEEYDEFADWERRFIFHKNTSLAKAAAKIPYVAQSNVRWYITEQIPNGGDPSAVLAPEEHKDDETIPTTFTINGQNYGALPATGAGIYLRHIWHGTVKGFYQNPQNGMTAYAWTNVYSPVEQDAAAFIEFYTYSRSGNEKGPDQGKWDRRGSRIWLNGTEIPAPQWEQPGANIRQDQNDSGLANENFTARPATPIHLRQGWNRVFLKLPHANNGGTSRDKWQFTFVITDTEGRNALEGLTYSPSGAIDSDAELVANAILEARSLVNSSVSATTIGYPKAGIAEVDLLAKIDEITPTLGQPMSAGERAAQAAEIRSLMTAFSERLGSIELNMPVDGAYYFIIAPRRSGRYVSTSTAGLVGNASASPQSAWTFARRADGTYNIISYTEGQYISPTAPFDSRLSLTATEPATGWTLKPTSTPGIMAICNGTTQLNQTNAGLNWAIYNWGSGNNLTDDGCLFSITLSDYNNDPVTIPDPVATILNRTLDGTAPVRLHDDLAAPVLASSANTAVIHATASQSTPRAAYIAATNTAVSQAYFTFATLDGNRIAPLYIGNNGNEGLYSQGCTTATNEVKVAIVCDPAVGYVLYSDGAPIRTIASSALGSYGHKHFGNVTGADAIYIGGLVTSDSTCKYPFIGTIHSVRIWDSALSAEQIAALPYTGLVEDDMSGCTAVTDGITATAPTAGRGCVIAPVDTDIYNLQGILIARGRGSITCPAGVVIARTADGTYKLTVK